jgi:hypothetical protein
MSGTNLRLQHMYDAHDFKEVACAADHEGVVSERALLLLLDRPLLLLRPPGPTRVYISI